MLFSDYKEHPLFEVDKSLLWEYDLASFDYLKSRDQVVARVIERGVFNDFYAILNIYGLDGVKASIRKLNYLRDIDMNFASIVFDIPLNELKCFKRKQLIGQHIHF